MQRFVKLCSLVLTAVTVLALCACSTSSSMSYTFNVSTGDSIKVTLDTSTGLSLTQQDGRFSVKNGDESMLEGIFIEKAGYDSYLALKGEGGMTILEDTEKDGNVYYMYEVEGQAGTEDNFILWVKDSNTGIILASLAGQENAKAAFDKLTLIKE